MLTSPLLIENLNDDFNEASEASAWNFFYKYAIYYQRAKFMMLHNRKKSLWHAERLVSSTATTSAPL